MTTIINQGINRVSEAGVLNLFGYEIRKKGTSEGKVPQAAVEPEEHSNLLYAIIILIILLIAISIIGLYYRHAAAHCRKGKKDTNEPIRLRTL